MSQVKLVRWSWKKDPTSRGSFAEATGCISTIFTEQVRTYLNNRWPKGLTFRRPHFSATEDFHFWRHFRDWFISVWLTTPTKSSLHILAVHMMIVKIRAGIFRIFLRNPWICCPNSLMNQDCVEMTGFVFADKRSTMCAKYSQRDPHPCV